MKTAHSAHQWLCAICALFILTTGGEILAAEITTHLAADPSTTLTFHLSNFTDISVCDVYDVSISQDSDYAVRVTIDADDKARFRQQLDIVTKTGAPRSTAI